VKRSTFVRHAPRNVDEAIVVLARFGHDASLAAGGQSLILISAPILNTIAALGAAFADQALADLLRSLESGGVPAGEVPALDRVQQWDQPRWPGLVICFDESTGGVVAGEGAQE
jgi:hypothetical protein